MFRRRGDISQRKPKSHLNVSVFCSKIPDDMYRSASVINISSSKLKTVVHHTRKEGNKFAEKESQIFELATCSSSQLSVTVIACYNTCGFRAAMYKHHQMYGCTTMQTVLDSTEKLVFSHFPEHRSWESTKWAKDEVTVCNSQCLDYV